MYCNGLFSVPSIAGFAWILFFEKMDFKLTAEISFLSYFNICGFIYFDELLQIGIHKSRNIHTMMAQVSFINIVCARERNVLKMVDLIC